MNLFLDILFTIGLIGSVTGIPEKDYKDICKMTDVYKSLNTILEKEEVYEDCDHSVGFHLTNDLCNAFGETPKMPKELTAYLSDGKIVLFVNIGVTAGNSNTSVKTMNLKRIKIPAKQRSKQTFTVVWIKTKTVDLVSPHIYNMSYLSTNNNNKTIKTTDLKKSLRNEEQIIIKDIATNDLTQQLTITFENKQSGQTSTDYSIEDSYLVLCLADDIKKHNCRPIQVHERGISCECDVKDQLTTFLILLLFWLLTVAIATKSLFDLLFNKKQKDHQLDFGMQISCNQRTAKYEYIIGIRLAKATPDFDLQDVNIDVEFLTANNEGLAPVFRFKANVLEKQLLTQIRIFMTRLTKLPEMKKIQCSHSGRIDGRITLFGVFVFCRRGTDDFKIYKVNKNICRESRVFPMIRSDDKEEEALKDEEVRLKTLSSFEINYSFLELIWILFVNISLIGFTAAVLPIITDSSAILLDMLITVLISSSVAIVFNFVFLKVYKCMLLAELRQQTKMNSKYETILFVTIRVYYIISIVVSILLGLFVGYDNISQKTVETYKWFCVTFCASALFCFVWNIGSHISCSKSKPPSEPSEELSSIESHES